MKSGEREIEAGDERRGKGVVAYLRDPSIEVMARGSDSGSGSFKGG